MGYFYHYIRIGSPVGSPIGEPMQRFTVKCLIISGEPIGSPTGSPHDSPLQLSMNKACFTVWSDPITNERKLVLNITSNEILILENLPFFET
jgi:hypothetical protein